MKEILKSVFNLKTILTCYISAIGYGVGYNFPNHYNFHPLICVVCCLILGSLFDYLANKILSTNYFNGSINNKIILTSCVFFGYVSAWLIINKVLDYDLDNDFLSNLALVIIIQIILLIKNIVLKYINLNKQK